MRWLSLFSHHPYGMLVNESALMPPLLMIRGQMDFPGGVPLVEVFGSGGLPKVGPLGMNGEREQTEGSGLEDGCPSIDAAYPCRTLAIR